MRFSRRRIVLFAVLIIAAVVVGWLALRPKPIVIEVGTDIQAVVDQYPPNTTYLLRAGVHRGQSIEPKDGDTFIGEDHAILNGALILADFTREDDLWIKTGVDLTPWYSGECVEAFPGCSSAEDVFFDDVPLLRVTTQAEVVAGAWFIDYDTGTVYLADDPAEHVVEMSITYYAFHGTASGVTIRNLIIEKYAGPGQVSALNGTESTNWTVENNTVRLNHGVGIGVGNGMRVLHNRIIRNGQLGVSGIGDNILIEGNEIAFNNYANFNSGWEACGAKFVLTNNLVVRGNYVFGNNGPGLWTDIDNLNTTYENNIVVSNASMGIFHEISYAAVIRGNTVKLNNASPVDWLYGAQILLSSSGSVDVSNNEVTVSAYGGNGIAIIQQDRGAGTHGDHLAANNYIHNNRVFHLGAGGMNGAAVDWTQGDFWAESSNRFDFNRYYVSDLLYPYWGWDNAARTWQDLQAQGQELNGTVTADIPTTALLIPAFRR